MIYVISLDESQIVKIGHGRNPQQRVTQLQIGSPTPLVLRWTHDGSEELEGHLHAVFAEYRIRGEWFDLTPLGDAVAAVQEAVAEAPRSGTLKAPRFRGPAVVHTAAVPVPVSTSAAQLAGASELDTSWDARFPSPSGSTIVRPAPKPDCIRAWKGECLRPAGMECDC